MPVEIERIPSDKNRINDSRATLEIVASDVKEFSIQL